MERENDFYKHGLTIAEVDERLANGKVNMTKDASDRTYLQIIFKNLFTFFNILMISLAAAMLIFCGPTIVSSMSFIILLILNNSIGIFQECKSKRTLAKLKLLSSSKTTVVREGKEIKIDPKYIVLDDVLVLSAGDEIPIDGYILNHDIIEINESMLTGESKPVRKTNNDEVLAGSYIISGTAYIKTTKIGNDTYIKTLENKTKNFKKPESKLMKSISKIIKTLSSLALPLAFIVFISTLIKTVKADDILTAISEGKYVLEPTFFPQVIDSVSPIRYNAVSRAVFDGCCVIAYMIPAGMMLLSSVAMANGVVSLSKKKTLTQDLYSVEALSRVDTLCLDKTGTITDGTMIVEDMIEINPYIDIRKILPEYLGAFKESNQTSDALIKKYGSSTNRKAIVTLPFSSIRKFSAVEFDNGECYALGAPDYLIKDKAILERVQEYSKKGLRVVAFVKLKKFDEEKEKIDVKDELAIIIISDRIRPEVPETLAWFKKNDVDIRIISGDNIDTVSYIAKMAGVDGYEYAYDMSKLSESDNVEEIVMKTKVFARVSPEQKAIIVDILKKNGRNVAMTGDGINDVVALKKADCSIALANGAPATKNISNLVLMDSNFSNLKEAVLEGRRVVNNIQRSATLFMMKDFLWMFVTILPILLGIEQVIQPVLMTCINFVLTGIGSFFITFEPDKRRIKGNFYKNILVKALLSGFYMFISVVLVYIFVVIRQGSIDSTSIINGLTQVIEIDGMKYTPVLTMMSLCVTVGGFIVFFDICKPFTKFRTILFTFLTVFVVGVLLAWPEIFVLNGSEYLIDLDLFNNPGGALTIILDNLFKMKPFIAITEAGIDLWIFFIAFCILAFPLYWITNKYISKLLDYLLFSPRDYSDE